MYKRQAAYAAEAGGAAEPDVLGEADCAGHRPPHGHQRRDISAAAPDVRDAGKPLGSACRHGRDAFARDCEGRGHPARQSVQGQLLSGGDGSNFPYADGNVPQALRERSGYAAAVVCAALQDGTREGAAARGRAHGSSGGHRSRDARPVPLLQAVQEHRRHQPVGVHEAGRQAGCDHPRQQQSRKEVSNGATVRGINLAAAFFSST